MTLSEWIDKYCEDNGIELPSGIPDEKTALEFISINASGGGERTLKIVNITWVDLPETFDKYVSIAGFIETKTADGYEMSDITNSIQLMIIQWDDEWFYSEKIIAYSSKAEIGEYAVVIPQNYLPNYKIVVKSGDADDSSNSTWLEVYGDCTLSIEVVE